MRVSVLLSAAVFLLSACQTQEPMTPSAPAGDTTAEKAIPFHWDSPPTPVAFESLPGWEDADFAPGLSAMQRSCEVFSARSPDALLSAQAPWAGLVSDWEPACAALEVVGDSASARSVLQAIFVPVEILSEDGRTRFTGYFEPTYQASLVPTEVFTEPIPGNPGDIEVRGKTVLQLRPGRSPRPYPPRAEITQAGVVPLAYARPGDVFFLQIQGSGRLILPDGKTLRAVYSANNGHGFVSTANWLIEKGWIERSQASMAGIRRWMDISSPVRVREAMNANPRFVFFELEPEGDPSLGPKGAMGVPLTPLGSLAIDLDYHAAGVPMFVQTQAPGLGGLWSGLLVAQDTGGAIKGAVRGDIYLGTGDAAGQAADTVNAAGRLWVLLPRRVAERIQPVAEASSTGGLIRLTP